MAIFFVRQILTFILIFVGVQAIGQAPFQGKVIQKDGREQTGIVLWHRAQDLILVFGEEGLNSFRPAQAQEVYFLDSRFGTQRHFFNSKILALPNSNGLAEVVGFTEEASVISLNPGMYIAPGSLNEIRHVLDSASQIAAYTQEDGPDFRRSIYRILRSFCKHHGAASAKSSETLYLLDKAGKQPPRKLTLGFALRQSIQDKRKVALVRAILSREGSRTRTKAICQYLNTVRQDRLATAFVVNR